MIDSTKPHDNPVSEADVPAGAREHLSRLEDSAKVSDSYGRNVVFSLVRFLVFAIVGVLLPSFLAHRMSTSAYGGLVLILQISNYLNYLDLGVQFAIAKYIAEFNTKKDTAACNRYASSGVVIMIGSCLVGIVLSLVLSACMPRLFPHLPADLQTDVAQGVLYVGISTSLLLAASPFAALFTGMQRYAIPTYLSVCNKLLYAITVVVLVNGHARLRTIGACIAIINTVQALLQIGAWKLVLPHVWIRWSFVAREETQQMVRYCAVLGFWSTSALIITGLDTTVVAHFDFGSTAFYAVAAIPLTFQGMLTNAALGPLLPAVSSLSAIHGPDRVGHILIRATRLIYLVLQLSGLPFVVFSYYVLLLWVGPTYATHGFAILRLLTISQMVRILLAPYTTIVIACGEQKNATLSGLIEAAVNFVFSIVLVKIMGAIGVAYGTLIGAVVGILVHIFVSFPRTQSTIEFDVWDFLKVAVLRPSVCALPSAVLLPVFFYSHYLHFWPLLAVAWLLATLFAIYSLGLNGQERSQLRWLLNRKQPG
jgi:O-antigen/teichoic acid export membrane protein